MALTEGDIKPASPEPWIELEEHTIDIENPPVSPPRLGELLERTRSMARTQATEELLWCLTHRPVALTRDAFITSAPDDFGLPDMPVRPTRLRFYDRSDAQAFMRGFLEETLKRAAADPRCTPVGACDVVHPGGEFYRDGPYMWARVQNDRYVLAEVNLWPHLRATEGCIPRLLDVFERLGVTPTTDNAMLADLAEEVLGPNVYEGICPCEAW